MGFGARVASTSEFSGQTNMHPRAEFSSEEISCEIILSPDASRTTDFDGNERPSANAETSL